MYIFCENMNVTLSFQPFKMVAWIFNWILSQIAWTVIRFEIHHLWDPDWTYAFPNTFQQTVSDNGGPNIPDVEDGEDVVNRPDGEQFMTGEEYDESATVIRISFNVYLDYNS